MRSWYFIDQSRGRFRVVGNVVGRDSTHIFTCDPDTSKRPRKLSNNGGNAFFQNIMQKVDSVVDFRDYLDHPDDQWVSFLFFNIYGHAESGAAEGGGQSPIMLVYTSVRLNSLGQHILVGADLQNPHGVVFWSLSEQALSTHDQWPMGAPDSVTAAYWLAHGVAAHEYGHSLGFSHTFCDGCPGGQYYNCRDSTIYVGYGSFDVMGYEIAFPDPENWNAVGGVSPYNPYYRARSGWLDTVVVNAPLSEYTLGDHLEYDACLKMPAYRSDASGQYFLVTAVTRRTPWDHFWPSDGVFVEHVNPSGVQSDRRHKVFDFELATGLWDWTRRFEPAHPGWGCDSLWTGENTMVRNTTTGLDSFDFLWGHNPTSWPHKMYYGLNGEIHPIGSPGNYFFPGRVFSDTSNPSSTAQQNVAPFAQNLPTMAGIRVLSVNPVNGNCIVDAWSRHWSGTVTMDALWLDSVVVDNTLEMSSGTVLTIQPGTKIRITPDARIAIDGRLIAQGTENNPIIFDCSDPNQRWDHLRIDSENPQNVMDHVIVRGARFGIVAHHGNLAVNHALVENCRDGVAFYYASGGIQNSVIRNDERYGAWIIGYAAGFHDNVVENNGAAGLRIWKVREAGLHDNTVRQNGYRPPDGTNAAGIQIICSGVDLQCNTIDSSAAGGLVIYPQSYADMSTEMWNQLVDNVAEDTNRFDHGQITLVGGLAGLSCGWNTIMDHDNARWLIYSGLEYPRPYNWDATLNYWGTENIEDIRARTVGMIQIEPILTEPRSCGHIGEPGECLLEPDELLFRTAWEQERSAQYQVAAVNYKAVVDLYPEGDYAKRAMDRLEFCYGAMQWSWQDIREYFQDLAEDSLEDSCLVTLALSNAAWCLAEMEDYEGAYAELDSLLDHEDPGYERTTVALLRLFVELKESSYEFMRARPGGSRLSGTIDETAQAFDAKLERISHNVDSLLAAYQHGKTPRRDQLLQFQRSSCSTRTTRIPSIPSRRFVLTFPDPNTSLCASSISWDGKSAC
jgi:hypothetical protein